MAGLVTNGKDFKELRKNLPALSTPHAVVIIGLVAMALVVAMYYGFRPLNLK